MKLTAAPENLEEKRLAALIGTGLLDSVPEQDFDDIVRLATLVCGTASGAFNLVDSARQWTKAAVGMPSPEIPRSESICANLIDEDCEILIVPDARSDERFCKYPQVAREGGIRFYAGVPLSDEGGLVLGSLSVTDQKTRTLDESARAGLIMLARQLGRLIALRGINGRFSGEAGFQMQQERELRGSAGPYRDLIENMADMVQCVGPDGRFYFVNQAWQQVLGYSAEEAAQLSVFDVIAPDCRQHCEETLGRIMAGERVPRVDVTFVSRSGEQIPVDGMVNCRFEDGKPTSTRAIFRVKAPAASQMPARVTEDVMTCICGWCRRIRDTGGAWSRMEDYFCGLYGLRFTHGVCHDCATNVLSELDSRLKRDGK